MVSSGLELLTTAEMAEADRLAVAAGVPSLTLMETAGRAVADEAAKMVTLGATIAVLCGPGNNGGDGYVAARLLKERGYDVCVYAQRPLDQLRGDAAGMARRWTGAVVEIPERAIAGAAVIVDALVGSGLARPLDGSAATAVEVANASGIPILAVDVPSGLDGTTGETGGPVVDAQRTVTFFCRKPGHLLFPGRARCGDVEVADIGIPVAVLDTIAPKTCVNAPALWLDCFPWPVSEGHKYTRGHAVVVSGPAGRTGAARLGACGALRIGAGLVTVASPEDAMAENAAHLTAIMLRPFVGSQDTPFGPGISALLADKRINAVLVGPGNGFGRLTVNHALHALMSGAAVVFDADTFTSFAGHFDFDLFRAIGNNPTRPVVLTPHEGEFSRVPAFQGAGASKLERARAVAARSGAVIVLKGPDTVIAAPDGRAAINDNAPPWLATAGSGDVLAGCITGLLAQRMPAFEAACAAVWVHGAVAARFGPGLIAEDLPDGLPFVLGDLWRQARAQNST